MGYVVELLDEEVGYCVYVGLCLRGRKRVWDLGCGRGVEGWDWRERAW